MVILEEDSTNLLNIKARSNINKHLFSIRELTPHIQRARQRNQYIILPSCSLLLRSHDPIIDGPHTITESGLRGAQFLMRGGQVLKLRGESGLEGAELRHGERCDVHCGRSVRFYCLTVTCRIWNISSYGICAEERAYRRRGELRLSLKSRMRGYLQVAFWW